MSYLEEHYDEIFKKFSDEELLKDIDSYRYGKGKLNKVLRQWFEECIFKCIAPRGNKSPWEALQNDEDIAKMFEIISRNTKFYNGNEIQNIKSFIRNGGQVTRKVANFCPKNARDIYFRYNDIHGRTLNCLDTSAGFGSRMSAVLLSGHNYYGIDPNEELYDKLFDYWCWLYLHNIISDGQECELKECGSEKEVKEVLIENEENYDIYNYAENIDIDYIPSVSEFSRKIKSLSQSSTTSFSSYKNKKRNLTKNKSNINLTKKRVIKTSSKKIKNNQSNLVNELLCRWWYALPQWPPEDYDISDKLREKKLRLINIKGWKKEPKNDEKGYEKCIQLPGFKYVVSDSNGKIYDFRPQKGKPSYSNFIKMPKKQLCRLLLEALKKQLEELNNRKIVSEQELRKTIKNKLEQVQRIFNDL